MEKQYDLNDCKVVVLFEDKLVRVIGSKQLLTFLAADLEKHSMILVKLIKADYLKIKGKRLKITNKSLIVEIWGHLYASHFANALKQLVKLKIIADFSAFVIKRSEIIDCGEAEIDTNRKFWDVLSNFNSVIREFLPLL
jgi:hypothetical protein